ncbi:hypothetical protein E4T51_04711 [Aureobasidium sp. EXF-12344]|nr:hypothetical protein E4T51_04711 [Aureobasidium sp. EXF-12344]
MDADSTVTSWPPSSIALGLKDIYGSRPGHQVFRKSPFYEGASFDGKTLSIISETDPANHKKMRAQLSNAFSDKSLRDQERLITEPIDLFIDQIGKKGDCPQGIDIVMWFNLMTFDIIGSLAFGERLKKDSDRPDFLTRIVEEREAHGISDSQIAAHSSDFIIAGSETTATILSCATYYLLRDPAIYDELRKEIRSAFSSYGEINSASSSKLKLVNAICLEAMRMYPPLPFALPRVVPDGGDSVDGYMLPEGIIVSTNPFAASMSSANFKDPFKFAPKRWLELNLAMCKLHYKYDLELVNADLDWHRDSKMHIVWHKPEMMLRRFHVDYAPNLTTFAAIAMSKFGGTPLQ